MVNAYFYSNIAVPTTLSGSINNSVTTCTVGSTSGWPATTPYIVALDFGSSNEELVRVTVNAAGTLTIVRAFGGTSAVSHSTGAVVRHVYNAQDATDFRTHEAATSAAHGIAGSFVGTTDSQTLTNKTLTSPTINTGTLASGALSGTFSGTPTFSGNLTFSGAPAFTGAPTFIASSHSGTATHTSLIQSSRTNSTDVVLAAIATGGTPDTFDRFRAYVSGLHEWGPGNAARDTNLYRSAADTLKTDDNFTALGTITGGSDVFNLRSATNSIGYHVQVTGDTNDRFRALGGGTLEWGPGNAVTDTNLYREGAGVLKTDGGFKAGGAITDTATGIRYRAAVTGTSTVSMAAVSQQDLAVNFGVTFAAAPTVTATGATVPSGSSALIYRAFNVTTTGFTLRVNDVGGVSRTLSVDVAWHALAA